MLTMTANFTKKIQQAPSGTFSVIIPIDIIRAHGLEKGEYYEFSINIK